MLRGISNEHTLSKQGLCGKRGAVPAYAIKGVLICPQLRMGEERAGFVGRVRGETDGNAAAGRNLPQDRHGLKGKVAFQGPLSLDGPAGGREGNQTVIHDLERDHLARFLHTGENVIHIADGTGGELIGDPVEVQAGTADQYLHAAVKQGLEVLGHLLIPGGQFYAGIHEQDGAGEIVGLDQRIEKHPHETW